MPITMLGSGVPSFTRSQLSLLTRSSAFKEKGEVIRPVQDLWHVALQLTGSTSCCDKIACLFQL
jgi:hypothetical protein